MPYSERPLEPHAAAPVNTAAAVQVVSLCQRMLDRCRPCASHGRHGQHAAQPVACILLSRSRHNDASAGALYPARAGTVSQQLMYSMCRFRVRDVYNSTLIQLFELHTCVICLLERRRPAAVAVSTIGGDLDSKMVVIWDCRVVVVVSCRGWERVSSSKKERARNRIWHTPGVWSRLRCPNAHSEDPITPSWHTLACSDLRCQ